MAKKSFSKLGQGADKLSENLQSFLISGEEDPEKEKEEVKIVDIPPVTETAPAKKQQEKPVKKEEIIKTGDSGKKKAATAALKKDKPVNTRVSGEMTVSVIPEDFKSHSILFSESQLSQIQEKVLLQKLHTDRKYSMKKAIFEAFTLWLNYDGVVSVAYPEDFKTYSALISESQFDKVLNKVYMHKARVDRQYSLKRALYEAIELFLKS